MGRLVSQLRDETYSKFAFDNARDPVVLYVSTNDGILHALQDRVERSSGPHRPEAKMNRRRRRRTNSGPSFPRRSTDLHTLLPGEPGTSRSTESPDSLKTWCATYDQATARSTSSAPRRTRGTRPAPGERHAIQKLRRQAPNTSRDSTSPEPCTRRGEQLADPSDADHSRGGPRFLQRLTEDKHGEPPVQ